jgi:hypothetical protein
LRGPAQAVSNVGRPLQGDAHRQARLGAAGNHGRCTGGEPMEHSSSAKVLSIGSSRGDKDRYHGTLYQLKLLFSTDIKLLRNIAPLLRHDINMA